MKLPSVLCVVLNYRTAELSLKAVEAALRAMEGIPGDLVLVDNASGDGSFEVMRDTAVRNGWDRVRVLQSGWNGGFGAGNNFGMRAGLADGTAPDYVYILNSDAFPDKGAIRVLLEYLEAHPDVGFAGSYIHGPDGMAHQTAFRFPSVLGSLEGAARFGPISRLLKKHIVTLPVPDRATRVDWLAGASLMMRRSVLDQIGGFDEEFFLYFEETDLCRRAAKAGWPTHYVRDSEVTHIGSATTGMNGWKRAPDYWFDSRLHYFLKNHGRAYTVAATLAELTGGLIWRLRRLVQRKKPQDPPKYMRDLLRHSVMAIFRPRLPAKVMPRADHAEKI